MGFPAKLSKRATVSGNLTSDTGDGSEGWGMGFFLVFFPQENHHNNNNKNDHFISSSPFKSCFIKRTNNNYSSHLLSKAQSTISICALLIFCTLLLFTLSTFEPNNKFIKTSSGKFTKRHLSQSHIPTKNSLTALQGLGTLYTRGTRPMSGLLLCHVTEHVTLLEVKMFLRAFYSSGLLSKTDLLFVFHTTTTPESFDNVIREENRIFINLIHRYKTELSNGVNVSDIRASFNVTQFVKTGHSESQKEPIWGKKVKNTLNSSKSGGGETESTRTSYGSVVGFGVGELDPENSLSGFVDHVSMSLRRWACYPMILGRLRRNFKHVMLVDVKEVLLLGDPLTRVKSRSPESVFFYSSPPTKHNRKASDKKTINPNVIMGGARGVRRLSAAMLTEIVRVTTHSKKKPVISESAILSRLVNNEFLQKGVHVMNSGESIHEASSLGLANHSIIRRGNSNIDIEFMKHICSFTIEAEVYTECGKVQAL